MGKTPNIKATAPTPGRPARAAITAVHGYVPPDVLTNSELAKMVDTSDAWITERTGIKERHILAFCHFPALRRSAWPSGPHAMFRPL